MEITAIPQHALPVEDPRGRRPEKTGNGGGETPAQVKKVAREFEAMFVSMMLKSMRETVGKDSLTGGGRGEETFRSLLDQEYASAAVAGGGIGLAQTLERELSRTTQGSKPVPVKGVPDAD
ncbi:rod-binding protein [Citrifermentans bremense]|uniref:rod-binding protein n=1 Tax=Citrifermentans bremense TaxID=60035 RepID=UPI00041B6F0E|nr:rod-binding protein [Citrifermentans bremense]